MGIDLLQPAGKDKWKSILREIRQIMTNLTNQVINVRIINS